MREVKFQAYLHDEKKMIDVPVLDFVNKTILFYDTTHCKNGAEIFDFVRGNPPNTDCPFERCSLRQNTGLKDKSGLEIFDQDIVQWTHIKYTDCSKTEIEDSVTTTGVITWDRASLAIQTNHGKYLLMPYHLENDEFEVVGNIFENPNLVEFQN